jgi:hypothetical protein
VLAGAASGFSSRVRKIDERLPIDAVPAMALAVWRAAQVPVMGGRVRVRVMADPFRVVDITTRSTEEETMVLATAKIGDFDRFWNTFSTKGAEKRKQHGCKGSHVFRDPNESDRVWAIFDWDEAGWQSFTSDREVPAIFQEAGFTQGPPKSAEFLRQNYA